MRTRKCYFLPFVCRLCICTQINSSLFLPTDSSTTKWQFCHLQKEFAIKIKCFNQIQILHLTTFIACIQITVLAIVIKFSVHRFNSYSIPLKLRSKVKEFQRAHRSDSKKMKDLSIKNPLFCSDVLIYFSWHRF